MDNPVITGSTAESNAFIESWYDSSEYVTAFTSGSTGTPKEIHLLKQDMIASARATNEFFGINSNSNLALPLSASYIAGKMMIVRSIVAGCNLYIQKPDIDPLLGLPENISFSLLPIVPAQIVGLLSHSNLIERVENTIVGGAPTTPEQEFRLKSIRVPVYATYGMTETASHVALRRMGYEDYYTALPGIEFAVDERSCLIIKNPVSSYKKIVTNDCVSLISPTSFRWLGRADNVINSGGIKINPEYMEKQLSTLISEHAFYITSRESEKWGREIILCVEGAEFDKESFMQKAEKLIDHKLLPKEIILMDKFPRTGSGKIIRM